jgi:hypothetical protein
MVFSNDIMTYFSDKAYDVRMLHNVCAAVPTRNVQGHVGLRRILRVLPSEFHLGCREQRLLVQCRLLGPRKRHGYVRRLHSEFGLAHWQQDVMLLQHGLPGRRRHFLHALRIR